MARFGLANRAILEESDPKAKSFDGLGEFLVLRLLCLEASLLLLGLGLFLNLQFTSLLRAHLMAH